MEGILVPNSSSPSSGHWLLSYWRSSIGKKTLVAISGCLLLGYLVLHMAGNLNSLLGPGNADGQPRVDGYAEWIRTFGEPLLPYGTVVWAVRALLLVALLVHVTGIAQLAKRNNAARPLGHGARPIGRSFAATTMMISGPLILVFVVFHILQFTTLTIEITPLHHGAVYASLQAAFQEWYLVALYVAAVLAVCLHLRHGIWSAAQTIGVESPKRRRRIKLAASGISAALAVGFCSVPLAFWFGVLPEAAA